jgi:L-alanine-DL-glutamate epimerase-like enolase superfamily enzyme
MVGYGEATAITYYDVTVPGMIEVLESKKATIERYALTDPQRFWHFLHHLIPGQHFLTAALDIAGWDLFAQMRRVPLYRLLGLNWKNSPLTDYTLGNDTTDVMVEKLKKHPWPLYKIKMRSSGDIDIIRTLRKHTEVPFRIDANEALNFEDTKALLDELKKLGVTAIEQPLPKEQYEEMAELKKIGGIPFFADESCRTEEDVQKCINSFDGINIKLTKCGGITPAIRMIGEAKKAGLKVMMGSMNESTIGAAAVAHLIPVLDEVDADGPLLLKEDIATGLQYKNGMITVSNMPGLGIQFKGEKFASLKI